HDPEPPRAFQGARKDERPAEEGAHEQGTEDPPQPRLPANHAWPLAQPLSGLKFHDPALARNRPRRQYESGKRTPQETSCSSAIYTAGLTRIRNWRTLIEVGARS